MKEGNILVIYDFHFLIVVFQLHNDDVILIHPYSSITKKYDYLK